MSKHSRRAPTKDAPESHRSLHHMRAWTDGQPEHVQRRRVVIHVKAQRKPTRRALKGGNCKHLHTHGASKSCHHLVGEESATWFSSATCPSKEQWHIPRLQQASIDQSSRAKFKSKNKDKNLLQMQRGLLLAHKAPHGQRSSPCTGCASMSRDLPARTNLNKASHRKGSHDIVDYLNGCSARGRWPRSGSARGRPRCGSGSGPPSPAQGAIRVANLLVSHALHNHAKRDSTITNSDCRPKRVAMDLMRCGRKDPSLTGATGGQNGARAGGPPKQSADPRLNRGGRWSGWRTSRWTLQPECSHGAPVHRTHATGTLLLSLCE